MAVNVDTVYQVVSSIMNKEQRGYLTPVEYNLFANQALISIFEQYFYDINLYEQMPGNMTEYSDMIDILYEKISAFETSADLTYSTDHYDLPSDLYRIGVLRYSGNEIERLNKSEYIYASAAPLTCPSDDFPVYTRNKDGVLVYGANEFDGTQTVSCDYIKTPTRVVWGYTSVLGEAQYNASTSVDFELHPSEVIELSLRILALAGVMVRDTSMYQIAIQEELKNVQQEKMR